MPYYKLNHKKIIQALNLFTKANGGSMSKDRALVLLWLADRYYLNMTGHTISGDSYIKKGNKIVGKNTHAFLFKENLSGVSIDNDFVDLIQYAQNILNYSPCYYYVSHSKVDYKVIAKHEVDTINKIIAQYNDCEYTELMEIVAEFPELRGYDGDVNMDIFFINPSEKIEFFSLIDHEIIEISKEDYDTRKKLFELIEGKTQS